MSPIETVYLIASAACVDALILAEAAIASAGYTATSFADFGSYEGATPALLTSAAVVLVDGWESSPGARSQADLAAAFGKPVLSISDLQPLAA